MCGNSRTNKFALGSVAILLTMVVVFGVWQALRPVSQTNSGNHQSVVTKNNIIGVESNTNGGHCSNTGLVTIIVCLGVMLGVTKCGRAGYCCHKLMGNRQRKSQMKEQVKQEMESLRAEVNNLLRQKKRENSEDLERKMGNTSTD